MNKKVFFIVCALILSSCVETVVVGSVAAGIYVASDSNISILDKDKDSTIKTTIEKSFKIEEKPDEFKNIDVKVYNSKVMLSGYVANEKYKKIAVNKTNSILNNSSAIDEITVIKNEKISSISDSIISTQISVKLRLANNINTNNYRYNVVNGVVYVIGESNNSNEITQTTKIISEVKGVKKVVSYIVLV